MQNMLLETAARLQLPNNLRRQKSSARDPRHPETSFDQLYEIVNQESPKGDGGCQLRKGVHKQTGKQVNIKVVNKSRCSDQDKDNVQREIAICRHLQSRPHPAILALQDVFESKKHIYLAIEHIAGGTLEDILQTREEQMEEREACRLFVQLMKGIKHLHDHGVVHRNICLRTLACTSFEDQFDIKISDFHCAAHHDHSEKPLWRFCGSRGFQAPEMYRGDGYAKAVDIWSSGVVLYVLISGGMPFDATAEDEVLKVDICEMRFSMEDTFWEQVSPEAKGLLADMLQSNSHIRSSVRSIFQHQWLKNHGLAAQLPAYHTPIIPAIPVSPLSPATPVHHQAQDRSRSNSRPRASSPAEPAETVVFAHSQSALPALKLPPVYGGRRSADMRGDPSETGKGRSTPTSDTRAHRVPSPSSRSSTGLVESPHRIPSPSGRSLLEWSPRRGRARLRSDASDLGDVDGASKDSNGYSNLQELATYCALFPAGMMDKEMRKNQRMLAAVSAVPDGTILLASRPVTALLSRPRFRVATFLIGLAGVFSGLTGFTSLSSRLEAATPFRAQFVKLVPAAEVTIKTFGITRNSVRIPPVSVSKEEGGFVASYGEILEANGIFFESRSAALNVERFTPQAPFYRLYYSENRSSWQERMYYENEVTWDCKESNQQIRCMSDDRPTFMHYALALIALVQGLGFLLVAFLGGIDSKLSKRAFVGNFVIHTLAFGVCYFPWEILYDSARQAALSFITAIAALVLTYSFVSETRVVKSVVFHGVCFSLYIAGSIYDATGAYSTSRLVVLYATLAILGLLPLLVTLHLVRNRANSIQAAFRSIQLDKQNYDDVWNVVRDGQSEGIKRIDAIIRDHFHAPKQEVRHYEHLITAQDLENLKVAEGWFMAPIPQRKQSFNSTAGSGSGSSFASFVDSVRNFGSFLVTSNRDQQSVYPRPQQDSKRSGALFRARATLEDVPETDSRVINVDWIPKKVDIRSPVRSLDQLFFQAHMMEPVLLSHVQNLADRHNGMFPMKSAHSFRGDIQYWSAASRDITLKHLVNFCKIKSPSRCIEKAYRCYQGDISKVVDIVRQCIVFENCSHLADALEDICTDPEFKVVRIKNRISDKWRSEDSSGNLSFARPVQSFASRGHSCVTALIAVMNASIIPPLDAGYRDVCVNLRILSDRSRRNASNLHVCEIQLLLKEFYMLKSADQHARYVISRNLKCS